MRIEKVEVQGFGTLINRTFTSFSPTVTLLTGKNEAGKTTFLEFVRRILFGFPQRGGASKTYEPISGAIRGGSISLILEDNRRFRIVRTKTGQRSNSEHILFENGSAEPITRFPDLIGSVNKDFFTRVFAITHSELCEGGTLVTDASIKNHLISGLLAVKRYDPQKILKKYNQKSGELFVPRGSNPEINRLNSEYQSLLGKLREIQKNADLYLKEREELARLDQMKIQYSEEDKDLHKRLIHTEILKQAREDWLAIHQQEELLSQIHIPKQFSLEYDANIEEIQSSGKAIDERIKAIEEQISENETRLNNITINEEVMRYETEILKIERLNEKYHRDRSHYDQLSVSIRSRELQVQEDLALLGQGWTRDRVSLWILSSDAKDAIITGQIELKTKKDDINRINGEIDALSQEIDRLDTEIPEIREDICNLSTEIFGFNLNISNLTSQITQTQETDKDYSDIQKQFQQQFSECSNNIPVLTEEWLDTFSYLKLTEHLSSYEKKVQKQDEGIALSKQMERYYKIELEKREDEKQYLEGEYAKLGKIFPSERLESILVKCTSLRTFLSQHEEMERRKGERDSRYGIGIKGLSLGIGILGLLGICAWILTSQILFLIFGILICIIAGYVVYSDRSYKDLLIQEELEMQEEISNLCTELHFSSIPTISELQEREDKYHSWLEKTRQALLIKKDIEKLEIQIQQSREEFNSSSQKVESAELMKRQYEEDWNDWKSEYLGKDNIPNDEIRPLLDSVKELQSLIQEKNKIRSRYLAGQERIDEIKSNITQFLTRVQSILPEINLNLDPESLHQTYAFLDERVHNEQTAVLTAASIRFRKLEREQIKEDRVRKGSSLQSSYDTEYLSFQNILNGYGLSADIRPERIESFIQEIILVKNRIRELENDESTASHLLEEIKAYEESVFALHDLISTGVNDESIDFIVGLLKKSLQNERERKINLQAIQEDIKVNRTKLDQKKAERDLALQELKKLCEKVESTDYRSYSVTRDLFKEKNRILSSIDICKNHIITLSGDPDGYNAIDQELAASDHESLIAQYEQDILRRDQLREEINFIATQIGSVGTNCKNLEQSEEQDRLMQKMKMIETSLQSYAREWAVYTLASAVLRQALEKFERERQPAVVHRAGEFFNQMTGGTYVRLFLPVDSDEFNVEMNTNIMKAPDILSQGTAEQLYTALRLSYAVEYCQEHESLPLILDDILINCDPARRDEAIKAIGEVATTSQVIYCTCHNDIISRFVDLVEGVQILSMDDMNIPSDPSPVREA